MRRLSTQTFTFAAAVFAFSLALSSQSLDAGLIATNIDLNGDDASDLVVGQTLDVTVTLDGFDSTSLAMWTNSVQLSEGFATPTNFSFGGPGNLVTGGSTGLAITSAGSGTIPAFDGVTVSLVGLGLFQPQFSFQTQVIAEGAGLIDVRGLLLPLIPLGGNVIDAGSASLTTFASSTGGSPSPPAAVAATPEPSSFAIFAVMGLAVACRRRRNGSSTS